MNVPPMRVPSREVPLSEDMSACDGTKCEWSEWRAHRDITDTLVRMCGRCGRRELRVLPPDVRADGYRREER